jgi:hypothetical protein
VSPSVSPSEVPGEIITNYLFGQEEVYSNPQGYPIGDSYYYDITYVSQEAQHYA